MAAAKKKIESHFSSEKSFPESFIFSQKTHFIFSPLSLDSIAIVAVIAVIAVAVVVVVVVVFVIVVIFSVIVVIIVIVVVVAFTVVVVAGRKSFI